MRRILPILVVVVILTSCASSEPQPRREIDFVLGTTSAVTIFGPSSSDMFDDVFQRLRDIEAKMSVSTEDYDDTELIEVNRNAGIQPVRVSADTFEVVETAIFYSRLTDGAFEVTIGPVVSLWGIGTSDERVPGDDEISAALPLVDYEAIVLDRENSTIFLPREGMQLDVGGIAKGYAADEAARILRDLGVEKAILDFGGNILLLGSRPDGTDWRIGVQNPTSNRGQFVGILNVQDATVVTSGNYERAFVAEDGTRYHHIIDRETGYPTANGLASVSILSTASISADALSTAVYVLGLERGMELVQSLDGVEAAFITEDRDIYMTDGFAERFELADTSFTIVPAT